MDGLRMSQELSFFSLYCCQIFSPSFCCQILESSHQVWLSFMIVGLIDSKKSPSRAWTGFQKRLGAFQTHEKILHTNPKFLRATLYFYLCVALKKVRKKVA